MRRLVLLILAAALTLPLAAQSAEPASAADTRPDATLAGSWALKVEGANVFRFDLVPDGEGWKGTWVRAKSFASTGDSFSRFSDQTIELPSSEGKAIGEWAELTFPDNRPKAVPDVFRFHLIGADRVEMIYADTGLAPFTLVRVPETTQLGPFEPGKVYRRVSVEMLGLPPEEGAQEPAPAPPAAEPAADNWKLPARRTDGPAPVGGR